MSEFNEFRRHVDEHMARLTALPALLKRVGILK